MKRKKERLEVDEINPKNIQVNPLSIKKRKKLEEKIKKIEDKYTCLGDVTDISGLRVITYFADDVDRVAEIIESEFEIDRVNSVDKREIMQTNRFGYMSLHYVVSLSEPRASLSENLKFKECKAEIQIRSVLQHAWAEIEHDLGYKTELEIPQQNRRRFARIAGLLEVADSEFDAIRLRLTEYREKIGQRIIEAPAEVLLDKLSLESYINESELIKEINQEITDQTGLKPYTEYIYDVRGLLIELHYLEIDTISELESKLIENREILTKWAVKWLTPQLEEEKQGYYVQSASISYLNYCLVAKSGSFDEALSFTNVARRRSLSKETFAMKLIDTYIELVTT